MPDIGWDAMDWRRGSRCFSDDTRLISGDDLLHCSASVSYTHLYLRPALDDMEEIVKFHINEVGPASARKIYADMRLSLIHI